MKPLGRMICALMAVSLLVAGCGYRNPYVYSGPEKKIYVTTWKNRTSDLQLPSQIYQELLRWYQKSGSLKITSAKEGADFILAGEIVSVDIPTLAFNAGNSASNVNLTLNVRYIFKDLASDKVLIQKPVETWRESYTVTADAAETRDNADDALEIIVEELAQQIYQKSLVEIAKL